jgi:hypothetical protein
MCGRQGDMGKGIMTAVMSAPTVMSEGRHVGRSARRKVGTDRHIAEDTNDGQMMTRIWLASAHHPAYSTRYTLTSENTYRCVYTQSAVRRHIVGTVVTPSHRRYGRHVVGTVGTVVTPSHRRYGRHVVGTVGTVVTRVIASDN